MHAREKMQFLRFSISTGSAETLLGQVGHHSIAYFLSNISAKNYRNLLMCVESIVCNISVVFFETQCMCVCAYALKVFQVPSDYAGIINPRCSLEPNHSDGIQSLCLNGTSLFSGGRDMSIMKWDLTDQQPQLKQVLCRHYSDGL